MLWGTNKIACFSLYNQRQADLNPNDLLRLATLLKLQGETIRLFSDTREDGNGEVSRVTSLAMQVAAISAELTDIAKQLGASEADDEGA